MLRASLELSEADLELAECFLFEAEQAVWNLYEDKKANSWILRGFFQDEDARQLGIAELVSYLSPANDVQLDQVEDKDWQNASKEFLTPWNYNQLHWVPIWLKDEYQFPTSDTALYYDADMAFGTGSHETTRLCGMGLYEFIKQNKECVAEKNILDAGCGSGILAISALLLGAKQIRAFDIDPLTMRVCKENLIRNSGKEGDLDFFVADLETGLPGDGSVDLLLANIQTHILVPSLDGFLSSLSENGVIIFSGILLEEKDNFTSELSATCQRLGYEKNFAVEVMGEWISVTLRKE